MDRGHFSVDQETTRLHRGAIVDIYDGAKQVIREDQTNDSVPGRSD